MKTAAIILITLLSLNLTGANKPKAPKRAYSSHKFYFAAWGAAGTGSAESQLARMKDLAAAGITDLLPNGDAKRLAELVKLGHQFGIRIHAEHWMMNVGASKECREHPDWYSVNRLGQSCRDFHPYVDYYNFLSPFSPGAREYIKNRVREVARVKGLASVNFDYIRYVDVLLGSELQTHYKHNGGPLVQDRLMAEYDFDYHPLARKAFKEQFGTDPMELIDNAENAAWKQFRMNAITSLVEECVQICHEEGTRASADVFPFPELAREYVKQDWTHWSVDVFFPMVYKKDQQGNSNWVGFATREGVRDIKKSQDLLTGLSVENYGDNMEEFAEDIKQAHDNGARGVTFWHANSLKEKHLAVIKKMNDLYNK
jgi:uncharacterized lipoprotein YddW (UPF0748 family)